MWFPWDRMTWSSISMISDCLALDVPYQFQGCQRPKARLLCISRRTNGRRAWCFSLRFSSGQKAKAAWQVHPLNSNIEMCDLCETLGIQARKRNSARWGKGVPVNLGPDICNLWRWFWVLLTGWRLQHQLHFFIFLHISMSLGVGCLHMFNVGSQVLSMKLWQVVSAKTNRTREGL